MEKYSLFGNNNNNNIPIFDKIKSCIISKDILSSNNIHSLKADKDKIISQDDQGKTLLHYACEIGKQNIAKQLLEIGFDFDLTNILDNDGKNALDMCITQLMKNNLVKYSIELLFRKAILEGKSDLCEKIINIGINVNIKYSDFKSPLHYACEEGNDDIVELLLDFGANVNAQDLQKNTPLHYACGKKNKKIAVLLLNKGANNTLKNIKNQEPFDLWNVEKFNDPLDKQNLIDLSKIIQQRITTSNSKNINIKQKIANSLSGGSIDDKYYRKYIKYKTKYMNLIGKK